MLRNKALGSQFAVLLGVTAAVLALNSCQNPAATSDLTPAPTTSLPSSEFPAESSPGHIIPLTEVDFLADPHSYEGPSSAVIPSDMEIASVKASAPQYPITFTSRHPDGEKEVAISTAERIVAIDLAGSIAMTVAGLQQEHRLVARDATTDMPHLPPVMQGGHSVNVESVLAVNPDLVITDGSVGPRDVFLQLEDAGITVVFVDNQPTFAGAEELARQVGTVLGVPAAGAELAAQIAAQVSQVQKTVINKVAAMDAQPLRIIFLYLRGNSGIYYIFGEDSGAGELITSLGAIDAATEVGLTGMRPLTDEAMVSANPDLILVMTGGLESAGGVDGLIADRPALALTVAGQKRRIVDMNDREILSFGPRSAAVVDALARAIYAPDAAVIGE